MDRWLLHFYLLSRAAVGRRWRRESKGDFLIFQPFLLVAPQRSTASWCSQSWYISLDSCYSWHRSRHPSFHSLPPHPERKLLAYLWRQESWSQHTIKQSDRTFLERLFGSSSVLKFPYLWRSLLYKWSLVSFPWEILGYGSFLHRICLTFSITKTNMHPHEKPRVVVHYTLFVRAGYFSARVGDWLFGK